MTEQDPVRTPYEEQSFIRSRSVVSRVVAGETLVVPVCGKVGDLASIYSFNGTGSLIWQALEKPTQISAVVDTLEREYKVGREQAYKDVKQFLDEIVAAGLLEILPANVPAHELREHGCDVRPLQFSRLAVGT